MRGGVLLIKARPAPAERDFGPCPNARSLASIAENGANQRPAQLGGEGVERDNEAVEMS